MGMMFQSFNLFGHLTVIENIMLAPMDLLHQSKQEAYDHGMNLLRQVGLVDKYLQYHDELSGGQKQRIAIARTLAMDPDIILLDEPTSALDPTMVGEVQAVIRDLTTTGKTMIIVTHEMAFAKAISSRVFFMDEGGIYEEGSPQTIFSNPQKEKTRRFINHLKVFEEIIKEKDFDFISVTNRLQNFSEKNQLGKGLAHNLQLVFEEVVIQALLPNLSEKFSLTLTVEYTESTDLVSFRLKYDGKNINPLDFCDEISRKLISNAADELNHSYLPDSGDNIFICSLRKKVD